jgi:hypothetical protein
LFERLHANLVLHKPKGIYQPSWVKVSAALKQSTPSTTIVLNQSIPTSKKSTKLGKTRAYRSKSHVPGVCNDGKTYAQTYHKTIPPTPTNAYDIPNVNKDHRFIKQTYQIICMHELSPNEWLEFATKCIRTSAVLAWNCEPLVTYMQYVLNQKKESKEPPHIYGPKMTKEQKDELLDAYYWVNIQRDDSLKDVLFFYRLYGYYVRANDGYRITKANEARQLILKRHELIAKGELPVKVRYLDDQNEKHKSRRGRKRKNPNEFQ